MVNQQQSISVMRSSKSPTFILLFVIIFLLLIILVGGFFYIKDTRKGDNIDTIKPVTNISKTTTVSNNTNLINSSSVTSNNTSTSITTANSVTQTTTSNTESTTSTQLTSITSKATDCINDGIFIKFSYPCGWNIKVNPKYGITSITNANQIDSIEVNKPIGSIKLRISGWQTRGWGPGYSYALIQPSTNKIIQVNSEFEAVPACTKKFKATPISGSYDSLSTGLEACNPNSLSFPPTGMLKKTINTGVESLDPFMKWKDIIAIPATTGYRAYVGYSYTNPIFTPSLAGFNSSDVYLSFLDGQNSYFTYKKEWKGNIYEGATLENKQNTWFDLNCNLNIDGSITSTQTFNECTDAVQKLVSTFTWK